VSQLIDKGNNARAQQQHGMKRTPDQRSGRSVGTSNNEEKKSV